MLVFEVVDNANIVNSNTAATTYKEFTDITCIMTVFIVLSSHIIAISVFTILNQNAEFGIFSLFSNYIPKSEFFDGALDAADCFVLNYDGLV